MKSNYLFAIALFTITISFAQEDTQKYGFNKGDFFIAGGLTYDNDAGLERLFVQPSIGYFLTSNISLGIQSEFLARETNDFASSNNFSAGINGRYYFMSKKRFNIFAEIAFDYAKIDVDYNTNNRFTSNLSNGENYQFSSAISSGFNFFVTKNLSIFAKIDLLKYRHLESEINLTDGSAQNIRSQDILIQSGMEALNFGIQYKF